MERCQEMSDITPTTALVAAIVTAATYHGRPGPRAMACVDGMTAAVSCLAVAGASRDEALAAPLLENLLGLLMRLVQACFALIRPVAALANMVGSTKVSKISLSAGLAGPGCPMLVAHCSAVLIGLSFAGGGEP